MILGCAQQLRGTPIMSFMRFQLTAACLTTLLLAVVILGTIVG
jgi:hypothetical protein